ncbi:MAG: TOBE domain-containing protein [Desulfobacterales bacterium]|nr:TOBE domain-containing protein [Desulfobacterales bacterium]
MSRRSLADLALKPGGPVFALVKSVAVSMGNAWMADKDG